MVSPQSPQLLVVGVDPGGTTGIATLEYPGGTWTAPVIELSQLKGPAEHVIRLVEALIMPVGVDPVRALSVEQFVVSSRAGRSAHSGGGQQAREIIGALADLAKRCDIALYCRAAGHVKPWATDRRVSALGVDTSGMGHGVDALRHGLFAAVHDYGAPDPLSKRSVGA